MKKLSNKQLFEKLVDEIVPSPVEYTEKELHLSNKKGMTIAHVAAFYHRLPVGFDQWNLANKKGWTVAHIAAKNNSLPTDFDQWDLADKNGWTVAHEAARYGHLPISFDQWDICDKLGISVRNIQDVRWGF